MELQDWIDHYAHAWETADVPEITSIFTSNASYRTTVFREPYTGHEAIAAYWRRGAGKQRNVKVQMAQSLVSADRVAVEWWTKMTDPELGNITLPGCLLLRFDDDGLCYDLWEYWTTKEGWHDPPEGWGNQ